MAEPEAIAIVGVGAIFPGARNASEFWREIIIGKDLITTVPATHWSIADYYDKNPKAEDKTYCRRGSFLPDIEFDPIEWGIPPQNIPCTDTSQLLALIAAKAVLKDTFKGHFFDVDLSRTSIILGLTAATELSSSMTSRMSRPLWEKVMRANGLTETQIATICQQICDRLPRWQENTFPGLLMNVVSGRIANRLNFGGTNCTTDAACASSFSALLMGINELLLRQSDLVVVGGVDTLNDIFAFMLFSKTPALSITEDCRPFSAGADGTILGEGLGLFALKRLAEAEKDGNHIYAVIRGFGSSSDGRAKSIYAPLAKGQAEAIKRAYSMAGYSPRTVELVEGHGTGTKAGDYQEFLGLSSVFSSADSTHKEWCALGSIKSQIGHTKGAAGAAGLFKIMMAIHHKILPPTIKVDTPNPDLHIEDSPFYLNTITRPWIKNAEEPRRAAVSSFGFGGTNFHITLEEYKGKHKALKINPNTHHLILLSGNDTEELIKKCSTFQENINQYGNEFVPYTAYQSYKTFQPEEKIRLALLVTDNSDYAKKIEVLTEHIKNNPQQELSLDNLYFMHDSRPGKIAFLFTGEGSEYLNMSAELVMAFDVARNIWDLTTKIPTGIEKLLHEIVFPIPRFTEAQKDLQIALLNDLMWNQAALGATAFAQLAILNELKLTPDYVAGQGCGEIIALSYAGAFDFSTLLQLLYKRGKWLKELSKQEYTHAEFSEVATKIVSSIKQRNFLEEFFFNPLQHKVYSAGKATLYPANADQIKNILTEQLDTPENFNAVIKAMLENGVKTFVEIGPDATLTTRIHDILPDKKYHAIALQQKNENGLLTFWRALAQLSALGVPLNIEKLLASYAVPDKVENKATKTHCIMINGANTKPSTMTENIPEIKSTSYLEEKIQKPSFAHLPQHPRSADIDSELKVILPSNSENISSNVTEKVAKDEFYHFYTQIESSIRKAHEVYQKTTAESHQQFLRMMEDSLHLLRQMETTATPSSSVTAEIVKKSAQIPAQEPLPLEITSSVQDEIVKEITTVTSQVDSPSINTEVVIKNNGPEEEMITTILAIIATETGYPCETLKMEMELEADLGIDSIKRVEILAAIQEKYPHVANLETDVLIQLKTLAELAALVAKTTDAQIVTDPKNGNEKSTKDNLDTDAEVVTTAILAIIAAETGYPYETLRMEMELEADLGIDSIKRVEILAAVQEKYPRVTNLETDTLIQLRTLAELAALVAKTNNTQNTIVSPNDNEKSVKENLDTDAEAITTGILAIIAAETGYPYETLKMEMELEADLGIDSIKRVEILAAIQEKYPHVANLETDILIQLKTLQELNDYLTRERKKSRIVVNQITVNNFLLDQKQFYRKVTYAIQGFDDNNELPNLRIGLTIIIKDNNEVATHLAKNLRLKGVNTEVEPITSSRLLEANCIIYLDGLTRFTVKEDAINSNVTAFNFLKLIANKFINDGGTLVLVQNTGGSFGLDVPTNALQAWSAGITALARTARIEWPKAFIKTIDVTLESENYPAIAEQLAREIFHGGAEKEVGIHENGSRFILADKKIAYTEVLPLKLEKNAIILVSGGARGVTAWCIEALAQHYSAHFILLGRSPLSEEPHYCLEIDNSHELKQKLYEKHKEENIILSPQELTQKVNAILASREIKHTLATIKSFGSKATYVRCDILDQTQLQQAIQDIRQNYGAINGLIHGAGIIADKLIVEKTLAQFHQAFDTKVRGLSLLLDLLKDEPLQLIGLFSSVASRYGNQGQCDYAMANEILNAVALAEKKHRGKSCLVKSFVWGPWEGGMVTPHLKKQFTKQHIALLTKEIGTQLFLAEITQPEPINIVLTAAWNENHIENQRSHLKEKQQIYTINPKDHIFLLSHCIKGKPVIPVCLVLEWFMRSIKDSYSMLKKVTYHDLKVLHGLRLENLNQQEFAIHLKPIQWNGEEIVELTLKTVDGILAYSCKAKIEKDVLVASEFKDSEISLDTINWPWNIKDCYGDLSKLFHGSHFHVIQSLDNYLESSASAKLKGIYHLSWPHDHWLSDPGLVDGAFQVASLFSQRFFHKISIPMEIKSIVLYQPGLIIGPVNCYLTCIKHDNYRAIFDVHLVSNKQYIMDIKGLEMVIMP